jgi:copper resistance protein D
MATSLLILARGFHFSSGMILVGVVAFRWLVLLPALADERDETWKDFMPLFRKLQALFMTAGIVLILSGFVLFWAVAAEMSGTSPAESLTADTLRTVLFQTQFGSVTQWRLGLAAVFIVMIWKLDQKQRLIRRKLSLLEMCAGLIATALVVSLAWTGHASASGGSQLPWRILADATHLLAASVWPTGLLPFALFLGCVRKIHDFSQLQPALSVVRRFSAVSFLTVGVLITSGILNSYFIVGSFQALVSTDYGRLLSLKLFLFFVILGIAAWNRYHVLPLLFVRDAVPGGCPVFPLLRRLQSFVFTEFGLAVAIVIVVSILGTTPPPR